jgi:hypothetical protein
MAFGLKYIANPTAKRWFIGDQQISGRPMTPKERSRKRLKRRVVAVTSLTGLSLAAAAKGKFGPKPQAAVRGAAMAIRNRAMRLFWKGVT